MVLKKDGQCEPERLLLSKGFVAGGRGKAACLQLLPLPCLPSEAVHRLLQAAPPACLPAPRPVPKASLGPEGGPRCPGEARGGWGQHGARGPQLRSPHPAEEALWTTQADGRVRLRLDPSCPQQRAYTVHQMFCRALDQYGHLPALGYKRQGSWERVTYAQYYLQARRAAKGFLKVRPRGRPDLPSQGSPPPRWARRPLPGDWHLGPHRVARAPSPHGAGT